MPHLKNTATTPPSDFDKDTTLEKTEKLLKELSALQEVLYAEKKHAVLIILQGTDASGKDGTVKHVFSGVNPMGCCVQSFKQPTEEELQHDFLWRVHKHTPPKGMIQIFNRSHYEDILVPYAHKTLPDKQIAQRMEYINGFEKMLADEGTLIVKFHLHISKEEQDKRLDARMNIESKHWKYQSGDRLEAKLWHRYTEAYNHIIKECSPHIPWTVVPSDTKWYRNYLVSNTLVGCLKALDMKYPEYLDGEEK